MRIVLANPPGYDESREKFYIKGGSRWSFRYDKTPTPEEKLDYCPYPFFIGYTSSLLKRDTEHDVKAVDGVIEKLTPSTFLSEVEKINPDLYITEIPTITLDEDLALLEKIKDSTGAKIAVAGAHATALPYQLMNKAPYIDYIFLGEYEFTAKELVDGTNPKEIKGLVFRQNGDIVINEKRELTNLDDLPWPDRDDLPATKYRDFSFREPSVMMHSSRGCPMDCIFCVERHVIYNSKKYRARKPVDVVDEMEYLKKQFRAKQIYFDDQSFTVNKKHAQAIANEIIERRLNIKWSCMGDAMAIDFETLKKMRDSGCIGMKIGLESTDPVVLKNIKKPVNLDKVRQTVEWMKELDILSHVTVMFGLPGATIENMEKTMDFVVDLDPDSIQFSIAIPFPGTPFYEMAMEKGYLIANNWSEFDGAGKSIVSYPDLDAEEIEEMYCNANCLGQGIRWGGKTRAKKIMTNPFYAYHIAKRYNRVFGAKKSFALAIKFAKIVLSNKNKI